MVKQRQQVCGAHRMERSAHPAFTLVELLVVIAIIGILVALLAAGDPIGPRSGATYELFQQSQEHRAGVPEL